MNKVNKTAATELATKKIPQENETALLEDLYAAYYDVPEKYYVEIVIWTV